jgi:hypothetical protein
MHCIATINPTGVLLTHPRSADPSALLHWSVQADVSFQAIAPAAVLSDATLAGKYTQLKWKQQARSACTLLQLMALKCMEQPVQSAANNILLCQSPLNCVAVYATSSFQMLHAVHCFLFGTRSLLQSDTPGLFV